MKRENHLPNMALPHAARLPRNAVQTKLRLLAGIAINATGALIVVSESLRVLSSSL